MANQISLSSNKNQIIIQGKISSLIYQGSAVEMWLKEDFENYEEERERIIVRDNSFLNEKTLNEFKKNITELIDPGLKIIIDTSFSSKIKSYEIEEDRFKDFSKKALSIWSSKYDTEELRGFSQVLEKKLPSRKLYKLQLLSSFHLAFSQNACNFSVPGAGKTSIVYGAFSYLNSLKVSNPKYVNKLIVVGPPSSFKPWEDEYYECFGVNAKSIRLNSETDIKQRINALTGEINNEHNLFLITYNSVPNLLEYLIKFCKAKKNKTMLVCDEAHKIKNLDGIWSSNILTLSPHVKSRVVLTGTPIPNGYEDLVNLFRFIYPSRDIIKFRADYLKVLNTSPYSSNVKKLIDNIRPYFIRIKKSDLNLPRITSDKTVSYSCTDFEKSIYKKLLEANEDISGDVQKKGLHLRLVQSIYNPKLLTKKQIDSHGFFDFSESQINIKNILGEKLFSQIESLGDEYNPSRHFLALSLTKEIIKKGGKVVLWGGFIDSIKRLHRLLSKNGLQGDIVIGETKKETNKSNLFSDEEKTRERIIEKFKKEGGGLDYIITNPIVLGESISLHKSCHHSIYFELGYSAAPYIQSRDRIHRVWIVDGKQKQYNTHYNHIVSNEIINRVTNIDQEIFNILRAKWKRMLDTIEQDIPLLQEDEENERVNTINKIIDEYRKAKL